MELDASEGVAKSETRQGGIQKILIDFDRSVMAADDVLDVGDVSVRDSENNSYSASAVSLINGNTTLAVELNGGLPDMNRYTVDISGKFKAADLPYSVLEGDANCEVRGLVGDVNNTGNLNLIDVGATKANGPNTPVNDDNCKFDIDTNGVINLLDTAQVKNRYGNTAP